MRFSVLLGCLLLLACSGEPGAESSPNSVVASESPGPSGPRVQPRPDRRADEGRLDVTPEELDRIAALCAETPQDPGGVGLLHDAHVHVALSHDQGPFAVALLEEMNAASIGQALIQPEHAPGMRRNPRFKSALRRLEHTWGEMAARCDRLSPLVYAFDPDDPSEWDYVAGRLATGHYAGVGEVEIRHGRLPLRSDPRSPLLERIYDHLEASGGVVHFQASVRDMENDVLGDPLLAIAREHPNVRFLWFGGPAPRADWPPNLLFSTVLHARDGLPSGDRSRFVWGSDAGPAGFSASSAAMLPYGSIAQAAEQARAVLAALDAGTARGIGRDGVEQLLTGASNRGVRPPGALTGPGGGIRPASPPPTRQ